MIDIGLRLVNYTVMDNEVKTYKETKWVKLHGQMYKVKEEFMFSYGVDRATAYRYNQTEPLELADLTTLFKIDKARENLSAQETKEAIEAKVAYDIMEYTYSQKDTIILVMLFVLVIVGVINVWLAYSNGSTLTAIANFLTKSATATKSLIESYL